MPGDESLFDKIVRRAAEEEPRKRANPYPGIRPFDEDTSADFFGRDTQIAHVLSHLERTHFAAVVGGSGCGKSSIVRAGVVPRIRSFGIPDAGDLWRVAIFKPQRSPLESLARALNEQVLNFKIRRAEQKNKLDDVVALLRDRGQTLDDFLNEFREDIAFAGAAAQDPLMLESFRKRVNLLIVADQFEEMFREPNRDSADAKRVVDLLNDVFKQQYRRIFVIITMRSEDLHECAAYQELPDAINAGSYLVRRLSWQERREAILRPALRALGWALQCDFQTQPLPFDEMTLTTIQRCVEALRDDPDHLPLMQHLLWRLWDEAEREGALAAAGETPHEIIKVAHLSRILELAPGELIRLVNDKDADLGCLLRGGEPRPREKSLKGALELHADGLYDTLGLSGKAFAEIVFRLLAERDRHGQEKRHWTDRAKIRDVLGVHPSTDHSGGPGEQKFDDDVDAVLEHFGITSGHPGEDSGQRHGSHRHPFLSMSPEGLIDVSHEAFIRKWPVYQNLLKAEEDSVEAYRAIVASFRRTFRDLPAPEQATEQTAIRRLTRRLRAYCQPLLVRWNLLFSPDSVVTSASKRLAVRHWVQGRVFGFESREAHRLRSPFQRSLRRLGRRLGLVRLTDLNRGVELARNYNEPWSQRYSPEIDKVQPEGPVLAAVARRFGDYSHHAKVCLRWHFGAKVVAPWALVAVILGGGGLWYNSWQAGKLEDAAREFDELHSQAIFSFTIANSEQIERFGRLDAQTTPVPAEVFRAELFEAAAALRGLSKVREELERKLAKASDVTAGLEDRYLALEQKLRYFQASVSAMTANVLNHFVSAPRQPGAGAAASNERSKTQMTELLDSCPDAKSHKYQGQAGELVAATKWRELRAPSAAASEDRANVWKAVYQAQLTTEEQATQGMHQGPNQLPERIFLLFGVVSQCKVQIVNSLPLLSLKRKVEFSTDDLALFVQYLPGKQDRVDSSIYRVHWDYSCVDKSQPDEHCENFVYRAEPDRGRIHENWEVLAENARMSLDHDLVRHHGVVSRATAACDETIFDTWKLHVPEDEAAVALVRDTADAIGAAEKPFRLTENFRDREDLAKAKIVDCAVSEPEDDVVRLAYVVDVIGDEPQSLQQPSVEQPPGAGFFLYVLELNKRHLQSIFETPQGSASASGGIAQSSPNGDQVGGGSGVLTEPSLTTQIIKEPIWWRRIELQEPMGGIAFGAPGTGTDGQMILSLRRDSTQAYKIAWSRDWLWKRACELLQESGVVGEMEASYHSREFDIFKREFNSLMKIDSGELKWKHVCD